MRILYCFPLILFLMLVSLNLSGQNKKNNQSSQTEKSTEKIKTESGLEYVITSKGKGERVKVGDKVRVHYVGKLLDGTKFDSSMDRDQPLEFKLGIGQVIKGWDEGIALLSVGDKATLTVPANLAYGEKQMGVIPPNSTLVFEVELIGISTPPKPWDIDAGKISKTESGLEYAVIQTSKTNKKPKKGDKVKVHYSGYFKDGKIFDSSVERNSPIEFPIGKGMVIRGWEEGLMLLNEGEKAKFIIPYHLAYGDNGRGGIPPKSDLIFDVELLEVTEMLIPKPFDTIGKIVKETSSGLKYFVVENGNGKSADPTSKVKVHYTGFFENGDIFDSSVQRGMPFEFQLGQGNVIKGWEEGIPLMKVGDKFRFVIPYQLAYGEYANGPIPAKATLIFDVELIETSN